MNARLKNVARIVAGQSPASDSVQDFVDGLPFIQGNAEFGKTSPSAKLECVAPPKQAQAGDVLISVRAPVGAVNVADRAYGIGRGLAAVRATRADGSYLRWFLESSATELKSRATGSTFEAISSDDLGTLRIPVADSSVQARIADFLDRETAKIDTLIEKQNALIERLRERRAEVIANGITKGIRGVELFAVDSDWIDSLPAAWSVARIHYDFEVVLGKMLDAGKVAPDSATMLPYVRAANIQPEGLDLSDFNEMPYTPTEARRLDLRESDLLVVEGGSVGVSHLLRGPIPGWSFQKTVNRVRSRSGSSTHFLHYVLEFYRSRGVFSIVCSGSTIAHLTSEKLRSMDWPKPPLDEQHEIADFLDRETAKIDSLIVKAERFVELARERRAALITAAVTGQLEVEGAA